MQREILFRGKVFCSKEWIYGFLTNDGFINNVFVLKESIGQFVGLVDKNGVKIFEGDILKETRLNGLEFYYKVFYKKGGLVINTHQDDFNKPIEHILFYESVADMQNSGFIETLEVIGNIHE